MNLLAILPTEKATSVPTVRKTMELQCTGIMACHVLLAMIMA